ncbi:MAG TPA: hypothetical protein VNB90_03375 [Cytophagaceae bacterium]|nr:hypothetical protein [Cytophagaceae bacterium]
MAFIEPWAEQEIESVLHEKYTDYKIDIDKVHILFLSRGIEMENVSIVPKTEFTDKMGLKGEIRRMAFLGIHLQKLFSNNDLEIDEVSVSEGTLKGVLPETNKEKSDEEKLASMVAKQNILVHKISFTKTELFVVHKPGAETYKLKEGLLNIYNIRINKKDTLTPSVINEFDFKALEFFCTVDDSMYTITASGIEYSTKEKKLFARDLIVHPNYSDYAFTSRKKYQTDCITATLNDISMYDFSIADFIKDNTLASSYVEVERLDMHVFRDKRKEFHHIKKPMFQELMYNYKGKLNIDSLKLIAGNIYYAEHAEMAHKPGHASLNNIHAVVFNISNDVNYKKKEKDLIVKGHMYIMGKARMNIMLKARLYDPQDAFYLEGSLAAMEADELNPMIGRNAFIYVTGGKIDGAHFNMRADKQKAIGRMTMLYHGLDVAVKDKKTNDTTAIKAKLISFVANKRIMDSNPLPGEEPRDVMILYERDPEKFVFNYCLKSLLSGVKATLAKAHKQHKGK